VDQPQRLFLRDLAFILGAPALVVAGLVAWWKPWNSSLRRPVITFPHESREAKARAAGIREATWHGLQLRVSEAYVILSQDSVVEVVEQYPPVLGDGSWGTHVAFLPLTARARQLLKDREANCSLAPGRCWEQQFDGYRLRCQQAAGAPVPELWWTPLTICEAPELELWVAINARDARRAEMWELVARVLESAETLDRGAPGTP
jgi:hypothetical protein